MPHNFNIEKIDSESFNFNELLLKILNFLKTIGKQKIDNNELKRYYDVVLNLYNIIINTINS
jgi:hypothetical protein